MYGRDGAQGEVCKGGPEQMGQTLGVVEKPGRGKARGLGEEEEGVGRGRAREGKKGIGGGRWGSSALFSMLQRHQETHHDGDDDDDDDDDDHHQPSPRPPQKPTGRPGIHLDNVVPGSDLPGHCVFRPS